MKNIEEFEFDLDDLIEEVADKVEDTANKSFDDLVITADSVDRVLFIGDIGYGHGYAVDKVIRFWNRVDDSQNIPENERKPIELIIDSNGGSLTDSLTIIDSIKKSKTPIVAKIIGCAYSGGFFITCACPKRIAYPHASFLFHEGATSTGGTANQFQNYAMFYKKQLAQLKEIVLNYTNIDEDKYKEIKNEDYWMDAEEALELGVIDEIL